jgi:hypothetical protein
VSTIEMFKSNQRRGNYNIISGRPSLNYSELYFKFFCVVVDVSLRKCCENQSVCDRVIRYVTADVPSLQSELMYMERARVEVEVEVKVKVALILK